MADAVVRHETKDIGEDFDAHVNCKRSVLLFLLQKNHVGSVG